MIEPANVRDLSYVFATMRPHDREETLAQNATWDAGVSARYACQAPHSYICRNEDHVPVIGFGAMRSTPVTVIAWLLASDRVARRDLVAVTRFVDGPLRAQLKREGYRWAEARALADYTEAHGWLGALGGFIVADLPDYGIQGQDFVLFRGQL